MPFGRLVRVLGPFVLFAALLVAYATGALATPVVGDFLAHDTGGQAVLEDMVVRPQALHDNGVTYVAYQGPGLDPYIIAFDHVQRTWTGPVKVGENPLDLSRDSHGAPALTIDSAGYLHVFYGAHATYVRHAISPAPRTITPALAGALWPTKPSLSGTIDEYGVNQVGRFTYPQPYYDGGAHYLVVRNEQKDSAAFKSYPYKHGWSVRRLADGATSWDATPTPIVRDSAETAYSATTSTRWYVSTARDSASGDIHAAMVALRDVSPDPYARDTVYYLRLAANGKRYTASGVEITATIQPGWDNPDGQYDAAFYGPWEGDLIAAGAAIYTPSAPADIRQNQVSVQLDPSGDPGVLFLSGNDELYTWRFKRWDSAAATWTADTPICETDQFFDAATFEFRSETHISAYVTTGGTTPPLDRTTNRGGSIVRYDSIDGGVTWDPVGAPFKTAYPEFGERYNDPQLVAGTPHPEARVLFCQWDNAGVNFVNKLFLASDTGALMQKEVSSELTRLSGADRVGTAIAISRESFPLGSSWVVLASSENFPDALAGVPLAHAFGAPILLVPKSGLTAELTAELQRLRISGSPSANSGAIMLGGTAVLPDTIKEQVATALYNAPVNTKTDGSRYNTLAQYRAKISREAGSDRYGTAIEIADRLASRRGVAPMQAVVASGESFADALTVSPVAAVNGWPILLTQSSVVTTSTVNYIKAQPVATTYVIGGSAVVTSTAETRLPGVVRIAGANRYKTSYAVAGFGAVNGLRRERLSIASGEAFPDALAGGVLAARTRGPLLITSPMLEPSGELESGLRILLGTSTSKALEWYILGGEKAVGTGVAAEVSSYLPATGQ